MARDNGPRFEDTMDALEAEREAAEGRFQQLLAQLRDSVREVHDSADRATVLYRARNEARRAALGPARDGVAESAGDQSLDCDLSWPNGGKGLRGPCNRVLRWLLRDYLEVLDRRRDERTRRLQEIGSRVDRLRATLSADDEIVTALDEALGRAHQALQASLHTHAEMLALVNAKDAEVLQRAVAGPLRRMEVLFDEFARQQEALLAQLVGRRRELDELVRAVTPAPEEEM